MIFGDPERTLAPDPARESFWMNGEEDEVALDLRHHLRIIFKALEKRPQLRSKLGYGVVKSGDQDARRFRGIVKYSGPDKDTVDLLEAHSGDWKTNPLSFWLPPEADANKSISRLHHRFATIVLAELRMRLEKPSISDMAKVFITSNDSCKKTRKEAEQKIKDMDDDGHRYMTLEKQLTSPGLCFVLGDALPESFWYKLLPKKPDDPKFKQVKDKLISIGIKNQAAAYADLRDLIVNSKIDELLRAINSPLQSIGASLKPAASDQSQSCSGPGTGIDAFCNNSGAELQGTNFSSSGANAFLDIGSSGCLDVPVNNVQQPALMDGQLLDIDWSFLDATKFEPEHYWPVLASDPAFMPYQM
ncbi:hypothetical protein BST61_g2441 [Cercospora zeina]